VLPEVTAIIQARMASTRLPGKVLMEVMGRPLLSYQIERLRFSKMIGKIIIATTAKKEDDAIVELCQKEDIVSYRGSEDDVLDRYYQAAKKYKANHIMRLTGDCPLLDPLVCEQVVEKYFNSNVDFVHTGSTFAEGVDSEVFSFKALEKAWNSARLRSEREHCTLYLHNHPEIFQKITLQNKTDDKMYRFCVDQHKDFLVVSAVMEQLYRGNKVHFMTCDIKAFLDSHLDIYRLNANIVRNEGLVRSLQEDKNFV